MEGVLFVSYYVICRSSVISLINFLEKINSTGLRRYVHHIYALPLSITIAPSVLLWSALVESYY
jgi:hypothetical protein